MSIKGNMTRRARALVLAAALVLMTAVPAMAESFSAIVSVDAMTVYRDAKLTQAVDELAGGDVVRVEAYAGKAAKIAWDGGKGYAAVSDMQSVDSAAKKAVVSEAASVFKSASETAASVAVDAGTHVYVLSWSGDWARVEKDGNVGYMLLTALEPANDDWTTGPTVVPKSTPRPAAQGTVSAGTLPVYKKASTSSRKLGTLKRGAVVNVISWNSKWAYIELNGNYGYCAVKGLKQGVDPTPEPTLGGTAVTVTASKLPVYKTASTRAKKLGTLKKGQTVNLLAQSGSWAYIEKDGNTGYTASAGLSIQSAPTPTPAPSPTTSVEGAAKGTVNVSSLPVYRTASTKADKLTTLKRGAEVYVLKYNKTWAYVKTGELFGFCPVAGLTRTAEVLPEKPTPTPSVSNAGKATVTDDSVLVYATASSSGKRLGTLMWGETVNVISVSDGWAYIEKAGNYGFCAYSALTLVGADLDEVPSGYVHADFSATVVTTGAKLYASASTGAAATSAALGTEYNVMAYSKDLKWAIVDNGGSPGYMLVSALNRSTYDTVSGTGAAAQTLLKALLEKGYYDGQVTASAASDMAVTAIKRFQAECGLSQTGTADQTVQRILYGGSAPASDMLSMSLSNGSKGENVTRLQTRLYALGYLGKSSSLDGDYGSTTAAAVALFQQANGLTASGTADAATLKALYSASANSKPSSITAADGDNAISGTTEGSVSAGGVVTPPSKVTLSGTYVTTMPAALKSTISSYSSGLSNAQKLEHAIYVAQSNLTKPYVYGATGPNSFDCSGLTQYCFKKISVSLKRSAYSQGYDSSYTKISGTGNLKRGDLVFFNTISDSDLSDHVGIYLGGGCFIHASSGGHKVVVSNLTSGFYNRVFSWGRRILN